LSGLSGAVRVAGTAHRALGQFDEARASLSEALELAERCEETHMVNIALRELVYFHLNLGELAEARRRWEQAITIVRRQGNEPQIAQLEAMRQEFPGLQETGNNGNELSPAPPERLTEGVAEHATDKRSCD